MSNYNRLEKPYARSYIRFLNGIPNSKGVDIYINGKIISKNLMYQDFTEYLSALPGHYEIGIYNTGSTIDLLGKITVLLEENTIYTAAITGLDNEMALELIPDKPKANGHEAACVRFINLSPDTPSVQVLINERLIIRDLKFLEVSQYICLDPGTYRFDVKETGSSKILITHPRVNLKRQQYYATYVVGLSKGSPELQILIPLEGASYLQF